MTFPYDFIDLLLGKPDPNAQPTVPLPPGTPAAPGDPYANTAGHSVVGSYMDWNGNIRHDYDPSYNQYDPVSRQGFDIHEGVHANQYLGALPHNILGAAAQLPYRLLNASQLEIPAYQKQIDFYQNYLMAHPMTTPGWANVLRTQKQMYDSLEDYSKK